MYFQCLSFSYFYTFLCFLVSRSRIACSIAFLVCLRFGLQVAGCTFAVSFFPFLRALFSAPGPVRFCPGIWPPVAVQFIFCSMGFGAAGCIAIFFCFHFSFPFCLCLCRSFLSLSFSVFLLFPLSFSLPLLSLAFVPYHDRVDLSFFLSKYILTLFFTVRLHTCSGSSAL